MKEDYGLFKRKRKKGIVWFFWYWEGERRIYKTTGKRVKWEANKVAKAFIEKKKEKDVPHPTFRQYADPYFVWDRCPHIETLQSERKMVTQRWFSQLRVMLERYVFSDPFADKIFNEITRGDVLDFRIRLTKRICNEKTGEGYNTLNKVVAAVKTIFKEALFREVISKDPTAGIGKVKYEKKEPGVFTPEELKAIFPVDSLGPWRDHFDYTCFLLAATTGTRRGEILALQWKHIDFNNRCVHIEQAWKNYNFTELGDPKCNQKRSAPLPQITLQAFQKLRASAERPHPERLIFTYDGEQPLKGTWWTYHFQWAMVKMQIDVKARGLKPHSLRHTWNTILLREKIDPARVRASLGWSNEGTQKGYTHWHVDDLREQADVADRIWGEWS
nr:hypothetical protein 2 [bacterium]